MATPLTISNTATRLSNDSSNVWAISDLASELQQQGRDIIRLCVGDPDFNTPAAVQQAVTQSLEKGRTHYSSIQGEVELRQAIAQLETNTSPHPCPIEEVVVFPGATNALFCVLSCLLNADDEIIVPDPMYIGYHNLFNTLGCQVTTAALDKTNHFSLDISLIEQSISPKTRVVLINTPGNPMGNMITENQLRDIAALCLQRGIWLVCDEVYSMITFDKKHCSLRRAAASLENIVMVDGLSKSHAMSGWRIGWSIAPADLSKHLSEFTGATMYGCSQFVQDAAAFTLRNNDLYLKPMREEYHRRRDYMLSRIDAIKRLSYHRPQAGMFVMADISQLSDSAEAFAHDLLMQRGVSTVPGGGFGPATEQYIRLTLAQPMDILSKAFDRLEDFICQR